MKNKFENKNRDENMQFNLKMGIIKIGEGVVKIENDSMPNIKYIQADIQTTGLVKLLYNAHYFYSAKMDMETGFPIKANKILNEGKFHSENEIIFDRKTRTDSCIILSQVSGQKIFPYEVYDILTGYYKFREENINNKMAYGTKWTANTYFADMPWDLKMAHAGEGKIKTIWGKIKCTKWYVSTLAGPIFKNENDLTMWFTSDSLFIPVKLKANLKIGSFNCELSAYTN